jgi:addiction module RelB/DinJ family antitoxin
MSTAIISIRTDSNLKREVQDILHGYGLTISSAFNQYMAGIRAKRIEPAVFNYTVPGNVMEGWEQGIREMKQDKNRLAFSKTKDLMKYLKSDKS